MLCCGCRKENRNTANQRILGEGASLGIGYAAYPQYQYYQPVNSQQLRRAVQYPSGPVQGYGGPQRPRMPDMIVQGDFRKVSGISSEVFRQIEAIEKEYDPTTAANLEAAEKRGEMLIRLLDPRTLGRAGAEAGRKYLTSAPDGQTVQFVEIIKRPGQTLGLYIREGDGFRSMEGVFISRIALESPVYNSGLLKVGDEVLAVNLVDVRRMSLDDVVIIMSIPRRLVLTIRSSMFRPGSHPSNSMGRRPYGAEEYRQPPVVIIKKELGEDDSYCTDEISNRDSENGHLVQARLKGLPSETPAVAVVLDGENIYSDEHTLYYNSQPHLRTQSMRVSPHARDDNWLQMYQSKGIDPRARPYGVVTNQPQTLQRTYPRTLENLAEQVHQYYSGYSSDVPSSRRAGTLQVTRASVHRPMMERSSAARHRYWDDVGTGSLRRNANLLRTGSESRIPPTISDDFLDRYNRPMSRASLRAPTPTGYSALASMQDVTQKRYEDFRSSISTHGIANVLRRRPATDGSVSDTEVGGNSSPRATYGLKQRSLGGRYTPRLNGRPSSVTDSLRSNSLPRQRTGPLSEYRYPRHSVSRRPQSRQPSAQPVRFDRPPHGYDEDSDGAASAPELPENRPRRLMGRRGPSPNAYSSNEYRQWLTRAPSTSAIYESVRRRGERSSNTLPSGLSCASLSKIAYSAESLLDTIRLEHQKNLLVDLYASRAQATGRPSPIPSLLLNRDVSSDSLAGLKFSHRLHNRPPLTPQSLAFDYLRGGGIPNPTPVRPSEDGRMHLLTLNPREFFKYRYEKPGSHPPPAAASGPHGDDQEHRHPEERNPTKPPEGFSGLLWTHLLAGRGLRATAGGGDGAGRGAGSAGGAGGGPVNQPHCRDLYCVIECDRVHKARTVVRSGESSFDWDEVFEVDLLENKEISFLLYSWDPQFRHKLCYKGVINLVSLSLNETPVHSLALKMEPRGTLYIKMRYKDPGLTFQRPLPQTPSPTSLFGIDLETVVNKENTGNSVPLIVKRCLEEIEKRGLDLVGIYRLCGSAVRKKMLREAFEKNAWLVDLSAEHVPDINVISSLVKDYLRELPEPLFTKALFDMMVDGLSVCLPDDPAGNAKLMFSILECLPKINRCTVLFLVDHLKLIETHSDRNKMTSQALATCFGPLFTCHSESDNLHKPIEVFKFLLEIWPTRKGSASRSASNDSILGGKGMQEVPSTSMGIESPARMSIPISSVTHSVAHSAAHPSVHSAAHSAAHSVAHSVAHSAHSVVYSSATSVATVPNSVHMSVTSSDHLPIATLTPGPSPTANLALTPTTPTHPMGLDNEVLQSSAQRQQQPQPHYTQHLQQQHIPHSQHQEIHSQHHPTQSHPTSQHQQQHQGVSVKKSVAWATSTSNRSSNGNSGGGGGGGGGASIGQSSRSFDSIC